MSFYDDVPIRTADGTLVDRKTGEPLGEEDDGTGDFYSGVPLRDAEGNPVDRKAAIEALDSVEAEGESDQPILKDSAVQFGLNANRALRGVVDGAQSALRGPSTDPRDLSQYGGTPNVDLRDNAPHDPSLLVQPNAPLRTDSDDEGIPGLDAVDKSFDAVSDTLRENEDFYKRRESDEFQAAQQRIATAVENADSTGGRFWAGAKGIAIEPGLWMPMLAGVAGTAAVQVVGGSVAGPTGAALVGAADAAGAQADETFAEVILMDPALFQASERYVDLVRGGFTEEEAKTRLATELSDQARWATGATSLFVNSIPGLNRVEQILGGKTARKAVTETASGGKRIADKVPSPVKTGLGEGITETAENELAGLSGNLAIKGGIDPSRDAFEGAGDSGVDFVLGVGAGAIIDAPTALAKEKPPEKVANAPANTGIDVETTAETSTESDALEQDTSELDADIEVDIATYRDAVRKSDGLGESEIDSEFEGFYGEARLKPVAEGSTVESKRFQQREIEKQRVRLQDATNIDPAEFVADRQNVTLTDDGTVFHKRRAQDAQERLSAKLAQRDRLRKPEVRRGTDGEPLSQEEIDSEDYVRSLEESTTSEFDAVLKSYEQELSKLTDSAPADARPERASSDTVVAEQISSNEEINNERSSSGKPNGVDNSSTGGQRNDTNGRQQEESTVPRGREQAESTRSDEEGNVAEDSQANRSERGQRRSESGSGREVLDNKPVRFARIAIQNRLKGQRDRITNTSGGRVEFFEDTSQLPDVTRSRVQNGAPAFFDPETGRIYVDQSRARTEGQVQGLVDHEIVHAGLLDEFGSPEAVDQAMREFVATVGEQSLSRTANRLGLDGDAVGSNNTVDIAEEIIAISRTHDGMADTLPKRIVRAIKTAMQKFRESDPDALADIETSEQIQKMLRRANKAYKNATRRVEYEPSIRERLESEFTPKEMRKGRESVARRIADAKRPQLPPAAEALGMGTPNKEDVLDPRRIRYAMSDHNIYSETMRNTALSKTRRYLRRKLSPRRVVGDEIYQLFRLSEAEKGAISTEDAYAVAALDKAIKGSPLSKLPKAEVDALLSQYMTGTLPDGVMLPDSVEGAIGLMRERLTAKSGQYLSFVNRRIEQILPTLSDEAYAEFEAYMETRAEDRELQDPDSDDAEDQGSLPVRLRALVRLRDTLEGRMDTWVNRSYAIHDNPDFVDDAKTNKTLIAKVIKEMKDDSAKRAKETKRPDALENVDDTDIENDIIVMLEAAGEAANMMDVFATGSMPGSKNLSIFKRRKNLSPSMRELLGEYTDPRVTYIKSSAKLGTVIANQVFLDAMHTELDGVLVHAKGQTRLGVSYHSKLFANTNDLLNPLRDYHTSRDIKEQLMEWAKGNELPPVWQNYMAINGAIKLGKTAFNVGSILPNLASNFMIASVNGHFLSKHAGMGMKMYMSDMIGDNRVGNFLAGKGSSVAEMREIKAELIRNLVLQDGINSEEMMRMLSDAASTGDSLVSFMEKYKVGRGVTGVGRTLLKNYQWGDDFFKVIGYFHEKDQYIKQGETEQVAEAMAAQRVGDSYQAYSSLPPVVQSIRRFPLTAPFIAFTASMIKVSSKMPVYFKEDMDRNPARAGRRLLYSVAALSAPTIAMILSRDEQGIDDEQDEYIRENAAPWLRNASLLYLPSKDGEIRFIDMSRYDPMAYFRKMVMAGANGSAATLKSKLANVVGEILEPVAAPELTYGLIRDVFGNTRYGQKVVDIYNKGQTDADQWGPVAGDISEYAFRQLGPSTITGMYKMTQDGEFGYSGKKTVAEEEAAAIGGVRLNTYNEKLLAVRAAQTFHYGVGSSEKILTKHVNDQSLKSEEDLSAAFETMMEARQFQFERMLRGIRMMRKQGMDDDTIVQVIRHGGASKEKALDLVAGEITPYNITSRTAKKKVDRTLFTTLDEDDRSALQDSYESKVALIKQLTAEYYADQAIEEASRR